VFGFEVGMNLEGWKEIPGQGEI